MSMIRPVLEVPGFQAARAYRARSRNQSDACRPTEGKDFCRERATKEAPRLLSDYLALDNADLAPEDVTHEKTIPRSPRSRVVASAPFLC